MNKEYESWKSFWLFSETVRRHSRYCWYDTIQHFLDVTAESAQKRRHILKSGSYIWRSQLGCEWKPEYQNEEHVTDSPAPYPNERMKPLSDEASEGRANPKGIPYLYTATDKETAMAEVRPWLGSFITVSQFKTNKDQVLIDCTKHIEKKYLFLDEPDAQKKEDAVWSHIDQSFSTPVSDQDKKAEYAPTQIIAELFKSKGFNGIIYKSALEKGYNVVLFDVGSVEIETSSVHQLRSMNFKFEPAQY